MDKKGPLAGAYSYILIVAAGALSYINALSNTFAWDDIYLVVKNPYIKGWSNLPHLFTTGYWESLGETGGLYRPLTMLSFLLEHSIAGLNPFIYHLDNILLHMACSITAYLVLRVLLPDGPAPLFGALLFAVHPVHSESVAWVSGRAELLSSLFFMLAFLSFTRAYGSTSRYIVAPGLYLLGMLSKETAATLPVFLLLYLYFIRKERNFGTLARYMAPFAAVLALYLPVRLAVLGGHVGPQTQMFENVKGYYVILTMLKAGFHYVRLALFPTDLQIAYIYPPPESFFDPAVLSFLMITAVCLIVAPKLARTRPALFYLGLWFFAALVPVSNIVPTEVIMTERAMYLPTVGAFGLLGVLFASGMRFLPKGALNGVMATVLACMCLITINRNIVWKDQSSINREMLVINKRLVRDFPDNPRAYMKLADSYAALGEIEMAGPLYAKAVELYPADCGAHYGLGNSYKSVGRLDEALDELYKALDCGYDFPADVHGNIAAILYEMGNLQDSERQLRTAMELDPYEPGHLINMGYILERKGDVAGAIDITLRADRMAPSNFMACYRLGLLYGLNEDFASAIKWLNAAVKLSSDDIDARFYLGAAYEASGDIESAKREYSAIMEKDPGNGAAGERLEKLKLY